MVRQIRIPKTPKSAYNPKRKPSDLIKSHIAQLEAVTAAQRMAIAPRPKKPRTESQASSYIAELTARLSPPVAAAPAAPAAAPVIAGAPATAVAAPPAAEPRRRRRAAAKKSRSRAKATRARAPSRTGRRRKGSAKK